MNEVINSLSKTYLWRLIKVLAIKSIESLGAAGIIEINKHKGGDETELTITGGIGMKL